MIKISIYSPGKPLGKNQESWLNQAMAIYEKRLSSWAEVHWLFPKDDSQLEAQLLKLPSFIALDPQGSTFPSETFSQFLLSEAELKGSRLHFVIGGAEGLSPSIKSRASKLISLSSLTFTHQIARLIIIEQLYRAFTIYHRLPYHK